MIDSKVSFLRMVHFP